MSSYWCDNPREHEREGRKDFERNGRYGYDQQQYHDHWDDCSKHYQKGFDEARREEERREEFREQQEAQQRAEERRQREAAYERQCVGDRWEHDRQQEQDEYEAAAYQEWVEQEHRKAVCKSFSRKRRRHWFRQHNMKLSP